MRRHICSGRLQPRLCDKEVTLIIAHQFERIIRSFNRCWVLHKLHAIDITALCTDRHDHGIGNHFYLITLLGCGLSISRQCTGLLRRVFNTGRGRQIIVSSSTFGLIDQACGVTRRLSVTVSSLHRVRLWFRSVVNLPGSPYLQQ